MAEQDPATVRAPTDPNQVKLGHAFRVGAEGDDAVNLMVTLLDRQDAALPIRRLRDWGLGLVNVQFGETVVDVGSGTGTMLGEFGTLVGPGGRAVGVEPNPRLRAVAAKGLMPRPTSASSTASPERSRSTTKASILCGASAFCSTSLTRMGRSPSSPGCSGREGGRWSSTPTTPPGSSPTSTST